MKTAPNARALNPVASAVYLHLNELRPNPRNPRAHGDEVKRLARTILRTTWGAPIIAQASTRRIIGGHGRLEAARLIVAGVEVDGILRGGADHRFDRDAPEPGMVPVRLVDVSDAEADAMTLADNAKALQGVDDAAAMVAMATASFERGAPTMEDIGLGVAELDALVKAAGDAVLAGAGDAIGHAESDCDEPVHQDLPPDAPVHSRTGEVYALGPHRLVCGDGSGVSPDGSLLVLDPPYDHPEFYSIARGEWAAVLAFHGYALPDSLVDIVRGWPVRYQFVWDGVSSWWTPNRPLARHKACTVLIRDPKWLIDSSLIPGDPGPPRDVKNGRGAYHYEPIAPDRVRLSTVFQAPTSREDGGHSHSKPERWVSALVAGLGALRITDPFAGSGTTMLSASRVGASATGYEIDPRYCDVIRRRWTRFAREAGVDPGPGALDS
jgi:hypothetical protein